MRAIHITRQNQKVKREKVTLEVKSKNVSQENGQAKILHSKTHTFTKIASNCVQDQITKTLNKQWNDQIRQNGGDMKPIKSRCK